MDKEKILKAASELFLKYGLRSVTIDDICNELHISKKTFYVHFKQKEELIESLLVQMRQQKKQKSPIPPQTNAIETMWNTLNALKSDKNVDKFLNFFYDLQKYYPEICQKHEEAQYSQVLEHIKSGLRCGVEQNLFRSDFDIDAMAVLLNLKIEKVFTEIRRETNWNTARTITFLFDSFLRMVANENGWNVYLEQKNKKHNL